LISAAIAIALVVLIPMFRSGNPKGAGPGSLAGQQAPVFTLATDLGAQASLQQYRGKIVVMNLWATWCPPCRAELPDLETLSRQYARAGVVVIGVNQGESAQKAQAFAQSLHITFPVWLDQQQRYGRAYQALGMPTTVVIDRSGSIVSGFDGALTIDQMRSALKPLVSGAS
jgi:peroxiredoxin